MGAIPVPKTLRPGPRARAVAPWRLICITIRGSFVSNRRELAEALAIAVDGKVDADIGLQSLSAIDAVFEHRVKGEVSSRMLLDFAG